MTHCFMIVATGFALIFAAYSTSLVEADSGIAFDPSEKINVRDDQITIIPVSDNEKVILDVTTLRLLEELNGTVKTLAERSLNTQPSRIYAMKHDGNVYVAMVYTNSSFTETCAHSNSGRNSRWIRRGCERLQASPLVSNMTVSLVIRDHREYVYTAYVQNDRLMINNLLEHHSHYATNLPERCTCSTHKNCLAATNDTKGLVLIKCANGARFLYNIFYEEYMDLPRSLRQVAIGDDSLATLITYNTGLNQDEVSTWNTETGLSHIITGTPGSATQHGRISDLAIKQVNRSNYVFYLEQSKNEIGYYAMEPPGVQTVIKRWPFPPFLNDSTCKITFKTVNYDTALMVEKTCNQSKQLLLIKLSIDQSNVTVSPTSAQSGCLTTSVLSASSQFTTVTVTVTSTVTANNTQALTDAKSDNSHLIYIIIIFLLIGLVTVIGILLSYFIKINHHRNRDRLI